MTAKHPTTGKFIANLPQPVKLPTVPPAKTTGVAGSGTITIPLLPSDSSGIAKLKIVGGM